jgi:hypothetical protein
MRQAFYVVSIAAIFSTGPTRPNAHDAKKITETFKLDKE